MSEFDNLENELNENPIPIPQIPHYTSEEYAQKSIIELFLLMAGETEVPKEFYIWSCISLISACLQSRVYFTHMAYKPIRPNMYIILVGDSGDGKGHAIGIATKIGQALEVGEPYVNLGRYKGKITSAYIYDLIATQKGEDAPTQHPLWLQSEELSNSIRTGDMARDTIKTLTDLWESHGGEILVEGTRTGGHRILVDPCINWLGGSTMTWLREVIDPADVDSGFLARTVVVHAKRKTQPIYKPDTSLYHTLLPYIRQKLEVLWSYEGEMTLSPEAEEYEREWYEVKTKKEPKKPFLFPTWKRRLDMVHKFAMLLRCAEGKIEGWREIPLSCSQIGVMMYEDLLIHYEKVIESIILGKSDKRMEKVQAFLRKYRVVTKIRLQQNVSGYGVRKDELNLIINTLLEQNSVRLYNKPGERVMMIEWIGE